ncbi:MAG: sugar phosphate isomerase/epimerase [Ruminococcaceae bacterium]|nr:sugar phosphate isomerase/epimerase [Oscillospiraceae bacterium]
MKKGINIWSFDGSKTFYEKVDIAKKAGFDGIELSLDMTGEVSLESTEKQLLEVKKNIEDKGLEMYSLATGLFWDFPITSNDAAKAAKAKEIVKKEIESAAILGCSSILVIPGLVNADFVDGCEVVEYDVAYDRAFNAISELGEIAKQYKVNIGLENVWNKFLVSPLELRDFIDKINNPYVGSYLDIGNVLFNGYPEHWVKILGSRIKAVHFKDYRRAAGGLHGFVDLLAGDVDYPAVIKALKAVGYDGWVSGEMIPCYNNYSDQIIYNTSASMDRIISMK